MKNLNELIKDIERDLVVNLTLGIRNKRISKKEARDIAREFMAKSSFKNSEEVFFSLNQMSEKNKIYRKIYLKYAPIYEREKDGEILKQMRDYMKIKDYENAIKIAKGGE